MSDFEFETENDQFGVQLDEMLDQLGPDRLPAGFVARTMAAVRLESAVRPTPIIEPEPFRLHWSDLVPAFVAAVVGLIVMFIWSGAAFGIFNGVQANTIFASANEFQLAALFSAIGLAVAAVPLFWGGNRSRNMFLLALS